MIPRPRTAAILLACVTTIVHLLAGCDARSPDPTADVLPPGPWGSVAARPLRLAPPADALAAVDLSAGSPTWRFRGLTDEEVSTLLGQLTLPEDQFAQLLEDLRPTGDGYVATPDPATVAMLPNHQRAGLYARLAQDPANRAQMNAFRYCGTSVDAWLAGWDLSPQTVALIEPLVYRHGSVYFFADTWALSLIENDTERARVVQALAAEETLQLTLYVPAGADVEPLVAYWSWGDNATDLRTLLRSLADRRGGGAIDVAHLLPPFARARLYRYPAGDTLLDGGDSRDCHWTAHNFFRDPPDDRFANADTVAAALRDEYEPVAEPRLGDLVVFRSGGEIYHSAVYIAANVVFTRNGTRFSRPWMFLPLQQMRDFYPRPDKVEIDFFRRL